MMGSKEMCGQDKRGWSSTHGKKGGKGGKGRRRQKLTLVKGFSHSPLPLPLPLPLLLALSFSPSSPFVFFYLYQRHSLPNVICKSQFTSKIKLRGTRGERWRGGRGREERGEGRGERGEGRGERGEGRGERGEGRRRGGRGYITKLFIYFC